MESILFIFSGLPASGKSTLAKHLIKKYTAVYLRIDTVEQGLRDLCKFEVQGEGYRLAYRIASDNLNLGNNVVADSCNPIYLTRKEREEVALQNNCNFVNIEVVCSNKIEHRKRIIDTANKSIMSCINELNGDIEQYLKQMENRY